MDHRNQNTNVDETARAVMEANRPQGQGRQLVLWIAALVVGGFLGCMGIAQINELFSFIAAVFTRLFQFIAVPTIALAVITTLSELGADKNTKSIFAHAVTYTLLTTFAAAFVGLALYLWIAPGNLPAEVIGRGAGDVPREKVGSLSYYNHFLTVVPNNMLQPFLSGNVLSIIFIAAAAGLGLAFMPKTENRATLLKGLLGAQELLFTMIRGLLWILPLGIMAFAAELSAQIAAGVIVGALGKYVAVVLGGNAIQFFIVLPLFLLARGLNPIHVFRQMSPALAPGPRRRSLHEELGGHAAGDAGLGGTESQGQSRRLPLRAADLHHHQHERLRGVYPRHLAFRHAERGLRADAADDALLGRHFRARRHRQRGRSHGLLLPDAVADVLGGRASRPHGRHPADLHHHRHDRDGGKRLVRLHRLRHDEPRPGGETGRRGVK